MSSSLQPLPWTAEVRRPDSRERERFLESHVDLVRYLALRVSSRLPASVELEDLVHDGILGLLDALEKYDPARGVRFRTYAESRVRGAILDGLRQKDWRPRSVRVMQRNLDETLGDLLSKGRGDAGEEEIAGALGLDLANYRSMLRDVAVGPLISLEELAGGGEPAVEDGARTDLPLEHKDLLNALADEIGGLPERERRVLELYYHDGLNMKEVGAVLGITESRVCQLHSQAAGRLRGALAARLHAAAVPVGASHGAGREK